MKTVILNTPDTVTLSEIDKQGLFGVCKDLLSKRGVITREGQYFYATDYNDHENVLPGTPLCGFYYKTSLIEELIRTGFLVVAFDTHKEMLAWLGDEFVEIR